MHLLAEFNPLSVIYYKWNYSWDEIKRLYQVKTKDWASKRKLDYEFLIDLASAALGGKKKGEGEYGLDEGDGLDEMTPEQEQDWREILGDAEFERLYGK